MKSLTDILKIYENDSVLVLTDQASKAMLTKQISETKKLYDFTYLSVDEFIKLNYFDYQDDEEVKLSSKLLYDINRTRTLLHNLKYLSLIKKDDLVKFSDSTDVTENKLCSVSLRKYNELEKVKNELTIIDNSEYLNYLSTKKIIYLSNHALSKDNKILLDKFKVVEEIVEYQPKQELNLYESKDTHDMYFQIFEEVSSLIEKGIKPSDIYLVPGESDSKLEIYAKLYNLGLSSVNSKLIDYKEVQDILEDIKKNSFDITKITKTNLTEKLVNIINKYDYTCDYELILDEVKNTNFTTTHLTNTLNVAKLDNLVLASKKYIFIFPLAENVIPSLAKDEDYFTDFTKSRFKLDITVDKNEIAKKNLIDLINSDNEVYLYLPKKSVNKEYILSSVISDLEHDGKLKINHISFGSDYCSKYSLGLDKILSTRYKDNFNKYNSNSNSLSTLDSTLGDRYNSFDNEFKPFDFEITKNNIIKMSFSSLDKYLKSSFYYYLENVLGIKKEQSLFNMELGSFVHKMLELSYTDSSFDFDKEFEDYYQNIIKVKLEDVSERNEIYLFKEKLRSICKRVHEIDKELNFDETICEANLTCDIDLGLINGENYTLRLNGKIDKIYVKTVGGTKYLSLVDYKTGKKYEISLKSVLDKGQNLQLPTYMYLAKYGVDENGNKLFDDNIKFSGMYYHKVIDDIEHLDGMTNADTIDHMLDQSYGFSKNTKYVSKFKGKKDNGFRFDKSSLNKTSSCIFEELNVDQILAKVEDTFKEAAINLINHNISIKPSDDVKKLSDVDYKDISYLEYKDLL